MPSLSKIDMTPEWLQVVEVHRAKTTSTKNATKAATTKPRSAEEQINSLPPPTQQHLQRKGDEKFDDVEKASSLELSPQNLLSCNKSTITSLLNQDTILKKAKSSQQKVDDNLEIDSVSTSHDNGKGGNSYYENGCRSSDDVDNHELGVSEDDRLLLNSLTKSIGIQKEGDSNNKNEVIVVDDASSTSSHFSKPRDPPINTTASIFTTVPNPLVLPQRTQAASTQLQNIPPAPSIPTNPSSNARIENKNNEPTTTKGTDALPTLERWSEYRIDAAKSINELEAIRHRLLSLLEKTNVRLKEMRVQKALGNTLDIEGAGKLSIKELIDLIHEEVEASSEKNVVVDSPTSAAATTAIGKRNHVELGEQSSFPTKKRRCCPLCLSTTHLASGKINDRNDTKGGITASSIVTCGICEDNDICSKCHSLCLKCRKITCADCFASCSRCNSSAYCSDCVDGGEGKCFVCCKSDERAQQRANKNTEQMRNKPVPMLIGVNQVRNLGVWQDPVNFKSPSHRINQGCTNSLAMLPPPLPAEITIRPNEADSKLPESYSEHRFFLCGDIDKIGFNVAKVGGKVTLSGIRENSVAAKHGVREGDVVILPGMECAKIFDYFIAAGKKPRPMIFHVQRSCSSQRCVHRFIVHEEGILGVRLRKKGADAIISHVFPRSVAEKHGLCVNDVICKPPSNGAENRTRGTYDWFQLMAKSNIRPFVFEVWRVTSLAPAPRYTFGDENPFLYRLSECSSGPFPIE